MADFEPNGRIPKLFESLNTQNERLLQKSEQEEEFTVEDVLADISYKAAVYDELRTIDPIYSHRSQEYRDIKEALKKGNWYPALRYYVQRSRFMPAIGGLESGFVASELADAIVDRGVLFPKSGGLAMYESTLNEIDEDTSLHFGVAEQLTKLLVYSKRKFIDNANDEELVFEDDDTTIGELRNNMWEGFLEFPRHSFDKMLHDFKSRDYMDINDVFQLLLAQTAVVSDIVEGGYELSEIQEYIHGTDISILKAYFVHQDLRFCQNLFILYSDMALNDNKHRAVWRKACDALLSTPMYSSKEEYDRRIEELSTTEVESESSQLALLLHLSAVRLNAAYHHPEFFNDTDEDFERFKTVYNNSFDTFLDQDFPDA